MSRERKFHNLIKNQNPEEKDRLWEKIEKELGNENITVVVPRKKKFPMGRFVAVASSCVLIVTIATIAVWKFLPEEAGPRYCTQDQYQGSKTDMTLKEYAKENNKELLYFDWYDNAELVKDYIYQLNDTNEIICFEENIISGETGQSIKYFVVDTKTKMDMLESFYTRCEEKSMVKNIEVYWNYSMKEANAYFEYNHYNYYLTVDAPESSETILELIGTLF
jgi:hypothetical protein